MRWAFCLFLASGFVLILCGVGRILDRVVPKLVVTFFDVGQGDSIAVTFPNGQVALVDAPGGFGKWNGGERVVLPEMLRQGRLSLDFLVMTHPDADHAQGLAPIAEQLSIREFLYHSVFGTTEVVRKIQEAVKGKGGRATPITGRSEFQAGSARMVLSPMGHACGWCGDNDRSVIVELEYGGCRVLLTADVEMPAESEWLKRGGHTIDLLKVAHHGSKTSSAKSFLLATSPQLAVASLGWRNRYHHPHPSVVKRYQALGIPLLRTDVDGFVEVSIHREGLMECRTWHGSCGVYRCSGRSSNSLFSALRRSRNSAARSN
ncbi:MAG: MBL fold metallo-hydrolase [Deltaproteobacteria bacterium]|nr:MBL fold metallo-hydrolase [Deltaproteobacteria bacterium]